MITGFVMYRSGYFDSTQKSNALHVSPNGGELNLAQTDQDTTKTPQINQNNQAPIMPSSKSLAPVFDASDYKMNDSRRIMPSSKSGIRLIDPLDKPTVLKLEKVELNNPYTSPQKKSLPEQQEANQAPEHDILPSSKSMTFPIKIDPAQTPNQIEDKKREAFRKQPELEAKEDEMKDSSSNEGESLDKGTSTESSEEESTPINWRGIWIGVLGIVFVAVGSIVYFKRRSR